MADAASPTERGTPVNDRASTRNLGIHIYGLATFMLGANELRWGDFAFNWHPVQPGVPYRTALAYIGAVFLIAAGLAVQWRRTVRFGLALSAVLYTLAACLWLPRVIGYSQIFGTWGGFNEQFVLAVAAVVGYASLDPAPAPNDERLAARDLLIGRTVFGINLVILGLVHFTALPQTAEMVPAWIPPGQRFWAVATGVAMVLAGVAIAARVQSVLAARLFTVLIGTFAVFIWIPRIVADPRGHAWAGTAITVAMAGAGWVVADALARTTGRRAEFPRAA